MQTQEISEPGGGGTRGQLELQAAFVDVTCSCLVSLFEGTRGQADLLHCFTQAETPCHTVRGGAGEPSRRQAPNRHRCASVPGGCQRRSNNAPLQRHLWSVPRTSSKPTEALRDSSCLAKQCRSLWRPLRASAGSTRPSPLSRSLWQHNDQQSLGPTQGFGELTCMILRAQPRIRVPVAWQTIGRSGPEVLRCMQDAACLHGTAYGSSDAPIPSVHNLPLCAVRLFKQILQIPSQSRPTAALASVQVTAHDLLSAGWLTLAMGCSCCKSKKPGAAAPPAPPVVIEDVFIEAGTCSSVPCSEFLDHCEDPQKPEDPPSRWGERRVGELQSWLLSFGQAA